MGAAERQAEGPRGSSRPPRRERQHDHQEGRSSRKRSPSKKPKGKHNVWKDVPERDRNVHKVGGVAGCLMRRCHCQIGRQGRTTGPPRGSWMMRPPIT